MQHNVGPLILEKLDEKGKCGRKRCAGNHILKNSHLDDTNLFQNKVSTFAIYWVIMLLWHHILWSPTSSCHPALKTDRPYLLFHFSRCPLSWFQSFLYVVDSLNIPTPDSHHLLDLLKHRHWGDSLLIVDVWVSWRRLVLSCASLGVDVVFPCCFQLWRVSGEHPAGDGQSEDGQRHSSHRWVR